MVPESPINADPDGRIGGRPAAAKGGAEHEHLADYRQRYGLALDPFADDPDFPLFTGAQRRELLDQLLHLCQFGKSLLVVLGDQGVGKTRLAHALLDSMAESDELCLITAQPGQGLDRVLIQIAHAFSLRREGVETAGQLLAALRSFSQPIMGGGDIALVVIDDAHHLDDQALAALLSLLQGRDEDNRRLHIAFFAEPTLIRRLDELDMQDVMINDFPLAPFTLHETVDYLNFRMEMADYLGPEIFNESLVEPWWREAQGQLPIIHEYARSCLLESVIPQENANKKSFPMLHIVAAAVLGAIFLMTFFYSSDDEEPAGDQIFSQPLPINPVKPAASSFSAASEASSVSVEAVASVPVQPVENLSLPESLPVQTGEKLDPLRPEQLPPAEQSAASARAEVSTSAEPAASQRAATSSAAKSESIAQSKAVNFSEDEQILLSWRASEFTLQLLGVSTEKAARDYIAAQPNRADLLMFKTLRQNKDWFVVVAGRYSSAATARQAVAGLPATQRKAGPWPRELRVIQQEIASRRL